MTVMAGGNAPGRLQQMERSVPSHLRPLVRAYILGFASSTVPPLLTAFITYVAHRRGGGEAKSTQLRHSVASILRHGLDLKRFPAFCAILVGSSTLLEWPIRKAITRILGRTSPNSYSRLSRWLSTFLAGCLSIKILQSKESRSFTDVVFADVSVPPSKVPRTIRFAGRTMDLTLFAFSRAADVIIGELWAQRRRRRLATNSWSRVDGLITKLADSGIFASSCALIMWAWVYLPERLPRAYTRWITGASGVDERLLTALRRARWGEFLYGRETGQAPLLESMCRDYGWPEIWGNPSKVIPIPCEMVHMGAGSSCEYHALTRFAQGFLLGTSIYVPLNVLVQLRNPSSKSLARALGSSLRSSAFLGSFIALFYYGVCLARTRIGPNLLGTSVKVRQQIDSGLCISSGCALCGWSLLLELEARRKDIALFVAPRALATIMPRRYEKKYEWRETVTFAASVAVVFTCAQENPERVRGVFGRLLATVLAA